MTCLTSSRADGEGNIFLPLLSSTLIIGEVLSSSIIILMIWDVAISFICKAIMPMSKEYSKNKGDCSLSEQIHYNDSSERWNLLCRMPKMIPSCWIGQDEVELLNDKADFWIVFLPVKQLEQKRDRDEITHHLILSSTMMIPPIINIDDRSCAPILDILSNLSAAMTQQSAYVRLCDRRMELYSLRFIGTVRRKTKLVYLKALTISFYHRYWW